MSATADRVGELVAPVATDLDLDVYDIEFNGGILTVLLDRAGGIDVDSLTEATRRISRSLDETELIGGTYTLEVSSPGLERTLRTPAHYRGAVGEQVKVKLRPGVDGDRRIEGVLTTVTDDSIAIDTESGERSIRLDDVDRARTHFMWEAASKPGSPATKKQKKKQAPAGKGSPAATAQPENEASR